MRHTNPLSTELGSVMLSTLGLAETVEWHLHQFRKRTGILCEFRANNAEHFPLPEEHAEALFDIYNEALGNVTRHAPATRVVVALTASPNEATLTVAVSVPIAGAPN
jgi:signal transduction histidine kinase